MIRGATLGLVSTLNKFARLGSLGDSLPPCRLKPTPEGLWPALRMEGRYGLGKSTQLVSMIEHAVQRDALILYIPRVQIITEGFGRGKWFYSCCAYQSFQLWYWCLWLSGFCVFNEDLEMYETPAAAREILSNFLIRNAGLLGVDLSTFENLKPSSSFLNVEYTPACSRPSMYESTKPQAVKNFLEKVTSFVREGLAKEMKETQALTDLLQLLRTQDDYPVLVAVDSCDDLTSKEHSIFLKKVLRSSTLSHWLYNPERKFCSIYPSRGAMDGPNLFQSQSWWQPMPYLTFSEKGWSVAWLFLHGGIRLPRLDHSFPWATQFHGILDHSRFRKWKITRSCFGKREWFGTSIVCVAINITSYIPITVS